MKPLEPALVSELTNAVQATSNATLLVIMVMTFSLPLIDKSRNRRIIYL